MNVLALHVYSLNGIPQGADPEIAVVILNERLATAKNVIAGLDREVQRLKAVEAEFEAFKKAQHESKMRRQELLKDFL